MKSNTHKLVQDVESLFECVSKLQGQPRIAVDTEFIREKTFYPQIALIQVATLNDVWLIDPLAFSKEELGPLLEVFWDPSVVKVMHAAHGDQEVLYWSYGRIAQPVLDTAIGAALLGMGDNIGLAKLVESIVGVQLGKGLARVKWLERPLSPDLLRYAHQDVAHLVEVAGILVERLKARDRYHWALECSEVDKSVFDFTTAELAERLSKNGHWDRVSFTSLMGLIDWREERAKKSDIPRAWVADNDTLSALAKARPRTTKDLHAFRGLKAKDVERSGERILAIVREAEKSPIHEPQRGERHRRSGNIDDHAVDLVKAFLALMSASHEISLRFLMTPSKIPALLDCGQETCEEWERRGLLGPHARRVMGADLESFIHGSKGLALESGRVRVLDTRKSNDMER